MDAGKLLEWRDDHRHRAQRRNAGVHPPRLARLLTAVLLLDCAREGLARFTVHILPHNRPALALARSLGAQAAGYEAGVSVLEIDIAEALAALRAETGVPGLAPVFAWFDAQGLGAAPTCG